MQQKNFDFSSPYFWTAFISFLLSIAAAFGIEFPESPDAVAGQLVTTVNNSGLFAVWGVVAVSIIGPIWAFIQKQKSGNGKKITFHDVISSTSTWIAFLSLIFAILVIVGVNIPQGTAQSAVAAIFAKDWGAVLAIGFSNFLNPLIRYLKDRKQVKAG